MASIRKIEGKNGTSYKITVCTGRDEMDKQIRHYKTWKPPKDMAQRNVERELQRIAVEFEQDLLGGFQVDNRQTFAEFAEYVQGLREQRGDRPQTIERARRQLERINKHIGHMQITKIAPRQLNNMYRKLAEPGQNLWRVFAYPVVDFNTLRGADETRKAFAERCGIPESTLIRIYDGMRVAPRTAKTIAEHLGRDDLFEVRGCEEALSPGTIRSYHQLVSAVMGQAYKEMILKYNPAERVTLPKMRRVRPSTTLQPDELRRVVAALDDEDPAFRTMVTVLIVTGCRRGEMFGLKWRDVSFEKGRLEINCAINYLKGRGVFEGPTKTEDTRTIPMSADVLAVLKRHKTAQNEWRLRMGDLWEDHGLVFPRYDGRPYNPYWLNHRLDVFCKKHDLPHIHPHTFRHTAASLMLSSGIDVLTVSKMLGHADTTTTLDIYGHAIETARENAAECISNIFFDKQGGFAAR